MADDTILSAAVGSGDTIRDFSDGTRKWPAAVASYVTGGSAGAWTLTQVQLTTGLPVQPQTGSTWAISAASLPLPTGAATAANQATANTSLASIDGKTPALGQALAAASVPVVLTALQVTALTPPTSVGITGSVAVTGTFWQATQPVSGTVTANAGTNLNTSALALETGGNLATIASNTGALDLAQASTTAGQTGPLVQGAVTTAAPTYTNAKTSPLSLTTAGALRVDGSASTQPVSAASLPLPTGAALEAGNLATIVTNTAALDLAQGSTTASQTGPLMQGAVTTAAPTYTTGKTDPLSLTTAGALRVDGSGVTQPVSIATLPALAAGSAVIGHVIVDSGTVTTVSTVTAVTAITNALPAGTNTIGNTVPIAATSGGATPYRYLAAAAANQDSVNVKNAAGQIYSIVCINVNAAVRYLKLYDKASAPTSADTPVQTYGVPGNTAGGGFVLPLPVGMAFASGISFRMTTGQADADTGAVTAADLALSITYK